MKKFARDRVEHLIVVGQNNRACAEFQKLITYCRGESDPT